MLDNWEINAKWLPNWQLREKMMENRTCIIYFGVINLKLPAREAAEYVVLGGGRGRVAKRTINEC